MFTVLIMMVLGLVLGLILRGKWDSIESTIIYTIAGTILGVLIALAIGTGLPVHLLPPQKIELASLRSADSIRGSFFLGSGSVGTHLYYYYYKKTADGGFVPGQLDVEENNVVVYEENRGDGELDIYSDCGFDNDGWRWGIDPSGSTSLPKYEFHIPKGSLEENFHLQ